MNKKFYLAFIFAGFSAAAISQNIARSVVASAGDDFKNPAVGELSWTLGEITTETIAESGKTAYLTQGFQQHFLTIVSVYTAEKFQIKTYPNPANSVVIVESDKALKYELVNEAGVVQTFDSEIINRHEINVTDLPSGIYMLILSDDKQAGVAIQKVIKTAN